MTTATDRPPIDLDLIRAWQARVDAGETVQSIADESGLSRPSVANYLRFLRFPPFVLDLIDSKKLSFKAARELWCFAGEDHIHLQELAWVVTNGGTSASRSLIRRLVAQAIVHNESNWRRLGGYDGSKQSLGMLRDARGASLHMIPESTGSAARVPKPEINEPWACLGKGKSC